jgi:hypothetical protein
MRPFPAHSRFDNINGGTMRFSPHFLAGLIGIAFANSPSAGVTNPDISAIGQIRSGIAGDPTFDPDEATLSLGECEFIFDAALNPYFRGFFTVAAGEEGFEVEEAYATVLRGLGYGLGLKAGRYRLGFGKLNPVHAHAYPFLDTPRGWAALLPGEEGFTEAAVQVSLLLPTPGTWASTLSADLIEGAGFHPEEEGTRLGWLGRWSNSFLFGDRAALEAGVSGATGMGAIAADARDWLVGGDLKLKFWLPANSQLVLQAEGAFRRSHATDSAFLFPVQRGQFGGYAFADYRFAIRWNAGALYDQAERRTPEREIDRTVTAFAGFAVMEESTLIRIAYDLFLPDGGDASHGAAVQFLFSMGPHKPHQF